MTQSLLQKLQQAAKQKKVPALPPPTVLAAGSATDYDVKRWNPIKAGCVCGFIVLLIIAAVLIINRLHEQSHNANLVRVRNEDDWRDLDVDENCDLEEPSGNHDPNFTYMKDLMQR